MAILGNMARKLMRARTGREVGTTLYGELEAGLDRQWVDLKPLVDRDDLRMTAPAHLFDALLAYLLTRSRDEQRAILAEGSRIAAILAALAAPGEPVMPGSYGSRPLAIGTGGGNNHGRDSVGQADSVPDVIARNTRRAARGTGRKKKRPKSEGSPAFGLGQ